MILAQLVLNGLMVGGLFAIVSVGLTFIFGITRVVNFAHGEFLMAGMYVVYLLTTRLGLNTYQVAPILVVLFFVVGVVVQRLVLQPLMAARDHHVQLFATVGLSTILTNAALLLFGADMYSTPSRSARQPIEFGGLHVLTGELAAFVASILLVLGLRLFLNQTHLGRAIRATAQHNYAARLMGVDLNRIYMVTFGIGTACVGLAACLVAPLFPTSPTIGTYFVLVAFVVVVLGGMGSVVGAFLGALLIGVVHSVTGYYVGSGYREIASFGLFLAILLFRPTGLLGLGSGSE